MDLSATLLNAIPLLVVTVVGGWLLNGRLNRLEARVDRLPTREELNARFESADGRFVGVNARLDRLDTEVAALRSDLTQVALAVGARTRPQTG